MSSHFTSTRTALRATALVGLAVAGGFLLVSCTSAPKPTPEPAVAVSDTTLAPGLVNLSRSGDTYFAGFPTAEGLRAMHAAGVRRIISLRTNDEVLRARQFDERALAEELGIELVVIPVTPSSFSPADVDRFAEAYDSAETPILVHCGSSNTVGGMWAAYLARKRGLTDADALAAGRAAGLKNPEMTAAAERVIAAPR
jgi:uncharacterized protein (TIGR01244 family)